MSNEPIIQPTHVLSVGEEDERLAALEDAWSDRVGELEARDGQAKKGSASGYGPRSPAGKRRGGDWKH